MIDKRIYSGWAFTENESEKRDMNLKIYKEELEPKSKCFNIRIRPTGDDLKEYTCYERAGSGYAHTKYRILSNPHNLTNTELALICDGGNLCFGHRTEGGLIVIHTD